jgi:predicted HicB family RNase H-like nuclease
MPRERKVDPAQRAKVLYVRVSATTHEAVKAAAAQSGAAVGDWCRGVIEQEVKGR